MNERTSEKNVKFCRQSQWFIRIRPEFFDFKRENFCHLCFIPFFCMSAINKSATNSFIRMIIEIIRLISYWTILSYLFNEKCIKNNIDDNDDDNVNKIVDQKNGTQLFSDTSINGWWIYSMEISPAEKQQRRNKSVREIVTHTNAVHIQQHTMVIYSRNSKCLYAEMGMRWLHHSQ